ncbi:MAG TPA: hypothetical protein VLV76_03055 [Candidatus Acidoferrum sp.]|nr:hypothetical protein [Candidatus Acidoferrum sp.]
MFWKRTTPGARGVGQRPSVDSDGKRRVFGEAVFAGKHGQMLKSLGFDLNDPANIIPDDAEFDRRIKESLAKQDTRRTQIEADLLRTHGHNAIRPFFVLAEPVFNSQLGHWLIRSMNLLPYDDWNLVYLPLDRGTQAAMGGLPLHPQQSIGPIDELMCKQIGTFHSQYCDAKQKVDLHVEKVGFPAANDVIARFVAYVDAMPPRILEYVAKVRPMIIDLIADVQNKSGA